MSVSPFLSDRWEVGLYFDSGVLVFQLFMSGSEEGSGDWAPNWSLQFLTEAVMIGHL